MCNAGCVMFGASNLSDVEISNKRIIEIGSYNVNGSFRSFVQSRKPAEYIGVDIEKGLGVDVVCGVENIIEKFGKESFDIVISMEMVEHVKNWRKAISNIKNICKPGGTILITTRSYNFSYHGFPYDFWRYEIDDMKHIFSDCIIKKLEKDPVEPGVFIKVVRPDKFTEKSLSDYELYSIILDKRVLDINNKSIESFQKARQKHMRLKKFITGIGKFVFSNLGFKF